MQTVVVAGSSREVVGEEVAGERGENGMEGRTVVVCGGR